jgi:outer membrane protein OmpA-like peptidoglycan-associated protein
MSKLVEFFKNLKPAGMVLVAAVVIGLIYGGKTLWINYHPKATKDAAVSQINDFPPLSYDKGAKAPVRALPKTAIAAVQSPQIRGEIMDWHAQNGILYANGGPVTTEGSLMADAGVNLKLMCQNDCNKQGADAMAFAIDYKTNPNSAKGCQLIAWMGDGVPSYIGGLNDQITKQAGADYTLVVFMSGGSSFGEDKLLGQPGWKQNPQAARGSLIAGVVRDGDWNIAMKWAGDNGIPVNNDLTTYDQNAINWINADDYIKAADIYISGQKETRKISETDKNGKSHRTNRDTTISINGVVTWTPGDANAVLKKGGLVTIASTKDYSAQMPCVWIGCKKWLKDNQKQVENFILASMLGGDQVKSHESALEFASGVAHQVYGDLSASDRTAYYKGKQVTDKNGNMVEIGGSRVWNLADNAEYFGLSGSLDKYKMVYQTFGDLDVKSYPEVVPNYPAYEAVTDFSYLTEVYNNNKNNTSMTAASTPSINPNASMSQKVSNEITTIEFDFGSANIRSGSVPELNKLAANIVIAENLIVNIDGYTDNVGTQDANNNLSQARADAIKNWLIQKDRKTFENRVKTSGHGPDNPIESNNTDAGRQKNRRVEITFGR